MTFFGVIWFIIVGYTFICKNIKHMAYLTLFFMLFQCSNVVYFGDKGIGPQILTSICFILKYLIICIKNNKLIINYKVFVSNLYVIPLAFFVIYSTIVNGTLVDVYIYILQLVVYIVCFCLFKNLYRKIDVNEFYNIIRNLIIFSVVFGIVQLLTSLGLLPIRSILKLLVYNDNNPVIFFNFNDFSHNSRLYGTFMEPSFFAGILVGSFYYLLSITNKWKENIILLFALGIMIILTTSSTAYGSFAITGVLFIIFTKQLKITTKITILVSGCIAFALFYFGFYEIMDQVIFSKFTSGSGLARSSWNRKALELYKQNPVFGVGYKNTRGSSIFYSLLAEVGYLGFASYLLFNIHIFRKLILSFKKEINIAYVGSIYAVISTFFCQLIACPDLDLCTYWFWLYICAIYESVNNLSYTRRKEISR